MVCYKCGCTLSETDFCTGCGADVGMYKKILALSNRYYNEGLEKCGVRDLSGAILSLKQSIKLNKNNVDARNLLGLVYFEIGEITEALGQWVISNNIRNTKNIAADYIALIQENPANLEAMNQNLRKFNQSLQLCYQDSLDYAVIQLKKILSVAPKYLKAHQLLALIYIRLEEWDKAKVEVEKSERIDANNTTTMRYKHEIETAMAPVDDVNPVGKKKSKKDNAGVQVYKSGNDTIIQPVNRHDNTIGSMLLNIAIGLLIGVAITYFLVLPSRIYAVNESTNEKIATISDEKDKKAAELDALKQQYDMLQTENDELKNSSSSRSGISTAADGLLMALSYYFADPDDIPSIASALEIVEAAEEEDSTRSSAFSSMYDYLMNQISLSLSSYYYELGYESYSNDEFEDAIPNLARAYRYNENNGDALFYLATSYRRTGDDDKAKELYAEVVDLYPGTERAQRAETFLVEMNN